MVKRWFVPTEVTLYAFQGYQGNKEELFWHRAHKMWQSDCFRYKDASMQFSLSTIELVVDGLHLNMIKIVDIADT